MIWLARPPLPSMSSAPYKRSYRSDDGVYLVSPTFARGYGNRRTKRVVYLLTEGGRHIGKPFASARLAKAFAEALAELGDDRRARHEFIRNGSEWTWELQKHFQSPLNFPDPRQPEDVTA